MKTTHTPGPWHLRERPNSGGGHFVEPGIATVHGSGRIPDANARLIAAAPDLLAALEMAVRYLPSVQVDGIVQDTAALKTAKDAIAKAKGKA